MNVTAHIDSSTPKGRKILRELEKNKKVVVIDNPMPVGEDGHPVKTYSTEEVENMVWDKLSDHYGVDVRKL